VLIRDLQLDGAAAIVNRIVRVVSQRFWMDASNRFGMARLNAAECRGWHHPTGRKLTRRLSLLSPACCNSSAGSGAGPKEIRQDAGFYRLEAGSTLAQHGAAPQVWAPGQTGATRGGG